MAADGGVHLGESQRPDALAQRVDGLRRIAALHRAEQRLSHAAGGGQSEFEDAHVIGFLRHQLLGGDALLVPADEFAPGGRFALFQQGRRKGAADEPAAVGETVSGDACSDTVGQPFGVADRRDQPCGEGGAAERVGGELEGEGIGVAGLQAGRLPEQERGARLFRHRQLHELPVGLRGDDFRRYRIFNATGPAGERLLHGAGECGRIEIADGDEAH